MLKSLRPAVFFCLMLFSPLAAQGAGVAVNEVLFNPTGEDKGFEWIEIYNPEDSSQDLSGWQLYPDGIGYFTFPAGFILPPKNFGVIHLRVSGANSAADLYFDSPSSNLGNSAGSVALFSEKSSKNNIKSFVEWGRGGETWESAAADAGLWTKGTFVATTTFAEGNSIALAADGVQNGADSWNISLSPTPGAPNNTLSANLSLSASASSSTSQSSNTLPHAVLPPELKIKAFAGEDKTVVVDSETEFIGSALGLKNEPLENARFWWNFGDGETKEGRTVFHIFQIPGKYLVGLHISNLTYAASDYLQIIVIPNPISVSGVLVGERGFLELNNPAKVNLDIGDWVIEDAKGKRFVVPSKTKIMAESLITFPNSITGILAEGAALTLFYPNGTVALNWRGTDAAATSTQMTESVKSRVAVSNSGKPISETVYSPKSTETPKETADISAPEGGKNTLFFMVAIGLSMIAAFGFIFIKKAAK